MESLENIQSINEDMYVVEKILKKRTITKGGVTQIKYLVKWQGYSHDQNTWQPEENLATVPQMIEKFERKLAEKLKRGVESQDFRIQNSSRPQEFKKEALRTKFKSVDRSSNKSQSQERYDEENGHKLRKQAQIFQKRETKKDAGLQSSKDSKQLYGKGKTSEPNPAVPAKKSTFIQIQDPPEPIKQYKLKEKVAAKQIPQKNAVAFGKVVNHLFRDNQLYYQIQKLSADKKVRKIQQLSRYEVEKYSMPEAYQYLSNLLINLEEARNRNDIIY